MRVDVLVSGVPPKSERQQPGDNADKDDPAKHRGAVGRYRISRRTLKASRNQVQVVNLLVTPEQAQILALASNQMKIQLVLRNPLDTSTVAVPETAMTNLFGGPKPHQRHYTTGGPRKPKAAAPPPFTITVLNGSSKSEEKFVTPGGQQ